MGNPLEHYDPDERAQLERATTHVKRLKAEDPEGYENRQTWFDLFPASWQLSELDRHRLTALMVILETAKGDNLDLLPQAQRLGEQLGSDPRSKLYGIRVDATEVVLPALNQKIEYAHMTEPPYTGGYIIPQDPE